MKSVAETKKAPRTARGLKTLQKLLDAAAIEFGQKGFHQAAINGITIRAGVALGTFYTYFDSKDEVFRALVEHMGMLTRQWIAEHVAQAPDRISAELRGTTAFIEFVRDHANLYRIVMESQFVAEDAYRDYYSTFADAYSANLAAASEQGEIVSADDEIRAWALIGMNVFLGMRYGVWDDQRPIDEIAMTLRGLLEGGLKHGPDG